MSYRVVWFKRDLRLQDHAALHYAAERGPVLCLYVFEPELWRQPEVALQHFQFIRESLRDLYRDARSRGITLQVVHGDVVVILQQLHRQAPFLELVSHEETGNGWTFERDKQVARWCRSAGIVWQEFAQFGVVRRLRNRDEWQRHWQQHMHAARLPLPAVHSITLPWTPSPLPDGSTFGLTDHDPAHRQRGGRTLGWQVLQDFLQQRSRQYRGGISSPLLAPTACSRLSPYLSYGCLSMREVLQETEIFRASLPEAATRHRQGLTGFVSRLHWHCHFIQKLESEPAIEWHNMHRGYDGLRETEWQQQHFDALVNGRTGWPLVDACVAMLNDTGWINFRMRAMLVSVASYPLWLHWRPVGEWLARQFLDYEPGIHWSQMQMQAGTTGINTTRVYNPIKQAQDHDPQGHFVRQWLPYMRKVPDVWLFEPWRMPESLQASCGLSAKVMPSVQVELEAATRLAKQRVHALRRQPEVKAAKQAIVDKHGSRAHRNGANKGSKTINTTTQQGSFDF